ncbi:CDP-glucose 4,6-dehydratase [Methanoregula sp. UBA64]|uniref:CDP-glucose 4,6-dehydratase n=1 Tax=Methanoregula sp. UBA64 TaxID=1915554 RepID=UPI0025F26BD2|nr:CDP-glucose 4,6-dehydratase [Methanoregula sp. UBA64]
MTPPLGIFRNKRVLVTGDTGFKGSWLAYWLHYLGANVHGFSHPPERDCDHFNVLGLARHIHHTDGEIRDYSQVREFMETTRPEFIFHLAAQPLVRKSFREPKLTMDTNIGGTVNVLEAVRFTPSVKVLVTITSDKCYRNKEWCWGYRESDELGGKDPYSASKAAAEIVYSAYQDSFFAGRPQFGAASVRAGNVIGGGDWSTDRIVPDCIRALQSGKPIVLRNPQATRPWQHVLEPLSGYLLLASRLYEDPAQFRGSYNFGPDSREIHTVEEVARALISVWGSGGIKIARNESDPPEAGLLHLNCDKAHHALGWYPRWNFAKTVERTAQWYKSVKEGTDAVALTRRQIIEYMESSP